MTASLPVPTRVLALVGALLLAALTLLIVRPLLLSSDDESAPSPATPVQPAPGTAAPTTPKIAILPGVPSRVGSKLQHANVVVVAAYTGTVAADRAAVVDARKGARASGASFVALNVLDENSARALKTFAGAVATPTVLVVKRPGKIVSTFEGTVERALVEQAAHNAGARAGSK